MADRVRFMCSSNVFARPMSEAKSQFLAHILVVDDDARLRALLSRFLRENGYAVTGAADAKEARELLAFFQFDLMVLDVMMPGESGIGLAASLGAAPPILMLSALTSADDRVAGLEVGVDDYLAKPFEPKELLLRIRAILRRATTPEAAKSVFFGPFVFELATGQLLLGGAPLHLTTAEAALLAQLARVAGKPVTREALARALGMEEGNERSVDVQITRLRKKIEQPERPSFIQTVRGAGYLLQGVLK